MDSDLVERARSGDKEAFSELVRQHYSKALGWANAIVSNNYIAEDIVQDALIRAFLHLGTLVDAGHFVPWLQRIVRNQAYMKVRRGGIYGKEQPFSNLKPSGMCNSMSNFERFGSNIDWSNIDQILYYLSQSATDDSQHYSDPAASILRAEMLQCLRDMLYCLGRRERAIFEAYFFNELSPTEIAELFQTSTANVYNCLSRARVKVSRERIRISLNSYVLKRAELGLPKRTILSSPPI